MTEPATATRVKTRYIAESIVASVFSLPRRVVADATDGKQVTFQNAPGQVEWFARLEGSSAISVGSEKPELQQGDRVRLIVEGPI